MSAALLPLVALAACGSERSLGEAAATSYDGPLTLAEGEGRHPRAGAARDVVQCDAWGTGGAFHGDVYAEGATSDTPGGAVETAHSEGLWSMPRDLAVAAESDDRVLYVAEVAGRAKAALVVHDGEGSDGAGGDGWYVESWAVCDVVELPTDFVEELGYEVWTDAAGRIVPTRRLEVFRGAEHCDWQDMTFLSLGRWDDQAPTFVRDPDPDPYLRRYLAEPYLPHTTLPPDAVDTGFRRGQARLWLAPDRSRAYVGTAPDDVEMWPRLVERLGCE
ncbi:hypothetical protein [Nocardioides sp. TF02-7]|uniref:hypothetical protein n=1 Tax=Nocardioides sp. TF02-7 TaxID=2917724 RepID=UPI001F051163|nr:hypothetical protein [Nocardioides sp. TF02-7]UMG93142.1 hypothetical protein MF408_02125 [Nocardioides sp. TF02-7]